MLVVFFLTLLPGPLFFMGLLLPGPMKEAKTIVIPRGSSVHDITEILDQNGVLIHPILFRAASRLMAKDQLKAGEYLVPPGLSVLDVTDMLHDGRVVLRKLTVPEGLTSYEITTLLLGTEALDGDIPGIPAEGSLRPETYTYAYHDSRQDLLTRMQKEQKKLMEKEWAGRQEGLPLKTPQEALILASIVEKETGPKASERALVASVFINRLRLRMPLQSDPTVIYALTDGTGSLGRKLTRADLLVPSPLNTYLHPGIPPKPISNPGQAALHAVLHPEETDFLYFVADGTGGHTFAKSLSEHNKNVSYWQSLRRP